MTPYFCSGAPTPQGNAATSQRLAALSLAPPGRKAHYALHRAPVLDGRTVMRVTGTGVRDGPKKKCPPYGEGKE